MITFVMLYSSIIAFAQIDSSSYKIFNYQNGKKSSEGFLINNQPEGYWKTYYENGNIKSEGNRKNFQLDSTWKFYNENQQIITSINYKNNKKTGLKITYLQDVIIKENYDNDFKNGFTEMYYSIGKIKSLVNFKNGKEEGFQFEYNKDSIIISVSEFKNGTLINRERINKYDTENKKNGSWKYYTKNGFLEKEENYKNGLKHGYFKEYSLDGNLIKIEKYIDNKIQKDAPEFKKLDVKIDYYPNGKIKIEGSYKDSIPEGVRRYYAENGEVINSNIFQNGYLIGDGIIDKYGKKQGKWKEYYFPSIENSNKNTLKAEGIYKNDIKINQWKFFHPSGKLEQIGVYNKNGKKVGEWKWYYESEFPRIIEFFDNGKPTGEYIEYDELGNIMCKGNYYDGLEDGYWYCEIGDNKEEGKYIAGKKEGEWKSFYNTKQLSFKGFYFDDSPIDKHTYYWENGRVREEGSYEMGKKNGDWRLYDYDGLLFLIINYKNGIELKYNGVKLEPSTTSE